MRASVDTRFTLLFLAGAALSGCSADTLGPGLDSVPAAHSIVDGAHGGNDGFFFLPPLVSDPNPTGTFDATAEPVVEICELVSGACTSPLVAEFTMTSGPGSETVRLVEIDEQYVVSWHTDEFGLDPAKDYRITVTVDDYGLGHVDVDVVDTGKELRNVDTGEHIGLKDGKTLPIKFRIEEGAIDPCAEVVLTDAALEAAVRSKLGIPTGPITRADAATMTHLSAPSAGIADLTGLGCFTALAQLNLAGNDIADLTPIAGLTGLTVLSLRENDPLSDLSPLSAMVHLEALDILRLPNLASLDPLAGLTALTRLFASNSPLVAGDISAVAGLTNLQRLTLVDMGITDLSALAGLAALEALTLGFDAISGTQLAHVASLPALSFLSIRSIQAADLSALAANTTITGLLLGGNGITDLSPLSGMTQLTVLDVGRNPGVTDLAPLAPLTGLSVLFVRQAAINGDVSALSGMSSMENLALVDVGLTDLSFVSAMPNLTKLDVRANGVSDPSPLLGLSLLERLVVLANPIPCPSSVLDQLEADGVAVFSDCG